MVLRVTPVTQPAAGAEFSVAVPGDQRWRLLAVTAQFSGGGSGTPAGMVDSSGNAHDGVYRVGTYTDGFGASGLVAGNACVQQIESAGTGDVINPAAPDATDINGIFDLSGDFSCEVWIQNRVIAGLEDGAFLFHQFDLANSIALRDDGFASGHPLFFSFCTDNTGYITNAGAYTRDTNPHHIVGTVVSNVGHIYYDGAEIPSHPNLPLGPRYGGLASVFFGSTVTSGGSILKVDEAAVYASGLSAARVAAHYAARGSIAGYAAAVLADSPVAYYHLADTGPLAQRYYSLAVSDGTTTVAKFTSGLQSITTGPTTIAWVVDGGDVLTGASDAQVQVGIPPMVLDPGYALSSATVALGVTDQWSNVSAWWDDGAGGLDGLTPLEYLNVHLVPTREGEQQR